MAGKLNLRLSVVDVAMRLANRLRVDHRTGNGKTHTMIEILSIRCVRMVLPYQIDIRSILHGAGDLSGPGGARECSRNHWRHTLYHLHRQTPRLQADKTKADPRQAQVATASTLPHPAKKKSDGLTTYSGSQQSCSLAGHGCPGKQSWNPPMQ